MLVNLNTNCFVIKTDCKLDRELMDMEDEYTELCRTVNTVMNKWNEVQLRHGALRMSSRKALDELRQLSERIKIICDSTHIIND